VSNIQLTGFLRFALYFKGEKTSIETGRIINGDREVREVTKAKTVYGDWTGGSYHPYKKFSEHVAGAHRLEIHRKNLEGETEVLWWEDSPEKVTVEWLAFTGMAPLEAKAGTKLPTFIRGMRVNSPVHGIKNFTVVEGI